MKYVAKERKGKAILKPLRLARRYLLIFIAVLIIASLFLIPYAHANESAFVWTDKEDYGPDETVTIFGSGFLANANVSITLVAPNLSNDTIYALTDGFGNFTAQYVLDGMEGMYTVIATDGTNTATTTFTEGWKRYFTATISPTTATAGETKSYTITITNYQYNSYGVVLGSAKITVPSGFTSVSIISVSYPSAKTWTATLESGEIKLKATTDFNRLSRGESVSVTFSATAPATTGVYEWTTRAWTDRAWGSGWGKFTIKYPPGQPTVTVTACRYFTATISPTTCLTGETKTYTITITNDMSSSSGVTLGSVRITIPSGFTAVTIISWSPPSGKTWTANVASGKINLDADSSSDQLSRGESVSVTFNATAPGTTGTYEWTTNAYGCVPPPDEFTIIPPQPTVTVTVPSTVSITITSSPVTGSSFVKVDDALITTPTTFNWTIGSTHKLEALSPVAGPAGTQYVWTSWSDSGTQTHDYTVPSCSETVTANYKTQYYLTVTSPYGTPGGTGWYDSSTTAYATLDTGVIDHGNDTRRVFTSWSGDATGTNYTQSDPITMNGPKTAIANWKTQYYLTVVSPYDTPGGEGWYDSGSNAYASLNVDVIDHGNGTRRVFTQWSGDASGTNYAQSNPITMNEPKTATANWKTQYLVTFAQTGLDATATGTVVTVDSAGKTFGELPFSKWVDSGDSVSYSYSVIVSSNITGKRFILDSIASPPSPFIVTGPVTITGNYKTQYYLTVTSPYDTPGGMGWYNASTTAYAALDTDTVDHGNGTRRIFTNWSGDATGTGTTSNPITMDGPKTAIANWKTQYYLTVSSVHGTPGGEGWYDAGDTAYATITPLTVAGAPSIQYVFTGWGGDASGSTSPSDPITMDGPKTAVANWKTQYLITFGQTGLDSNATGTVVTVNGSAKIFGDLPFTWWVDNCSWVEYSYIVTVSSLDPNENFTLINVTGPVSPFHVGGPVTVTGNYQSVYKVQYYLDVSSDYGTAGGIGWYDDGDTAYATLDISVIDHANGTRRVFTHWSGDTTGTNYAQSDPITMDGNKTAIANWQTQYYLTVTSAHGTPSGEDWYNASDTAYATINPLTVAGPTGVQYVFTGWSGDASGSGSPSNPITMDGPKTAVADWKTQYYLTVSSPYGTPGGEGWYDSGSTAYATISPLTVSGSPDVQYVFIGWSGNASGSSSPSNPITMNGPKTAIANWETQYYLTVNTDPAGLSPAPTPSSGWYDNCTYVILTAPDQSDLNDDKYLFSHWDVDGTNVTGNPINVHMDQPHTATAHYVALSKCVVDFTEDPESPISFGTTVTFTVNVTQKAFNGTHEVNCTLYEWNITDPNGVSHILRYGKQWNNFSDTMQWTFDVYGYWTVTLRAFCNDTTLIDAGMAWSDPASHPKMVLQPVGGHVIPVCKLDLLVPWTGFVFSLLAVMAATIALFRRGSRKH